MNLYQRINLIQLKISSVYKGAKVSMGNSGSYNAVSHDDVTALLHQPIADVGIIAFPNMESADVESYETVKSYNGKDTVSTGYKVKVWASITFINMDKPDERITTKCFSYALDNGDKATGKAYSMAIKYCYLKTFMLESCDEEESRDYEQSYKPKPDYSQTAVTSGHQAPSTFKDGVATDQQQKAIFAISKAKGIAKPTIDSFEEAKKWITEQNKGK